MVGPVLPWQPLEGKPWQGEVAVSPRGPGWDRGPERLPEMQKDTPFQGAEGCEDCSTAGVQWSVCAHLSHQCLTASFQAPKLRVSGGLELESSPFLLLGLHRWHCWSQLCPWC